MPQPPNLKMITEATLDSKVVEKLNDPESGVAGALSAAIVDVIASDGTVVAAAETATSNAAQGLGYVLSNPGKNLYNAATDTLGGYLNQGGTWTVLAGYRASDFIKVTAGQAYTISQARFVNLYTTDKTWVSGIMQTQGVYTFTPAQSGYLRFSYSYTGTGTAITPLVQVEKGSAATAYESYRQVISGYTMEGAAGAPLTVTRAGNILTIASALGGTPLSISATLAGGGNEVFNFIQTILASSAVHVTADDVAPIRTQHGTVGANHGFAFMGAWAPANHDKTVVDLGSVWTDGTREYVLLSINAAGQAIFGGSYTTDGSGVVQHVTVAPIADLTHVSGAVHTTALVHTSRLATGVVQMYPAIGKKRQTVLLDAAILTDGTVGGNELEIRESYEVLDYASIYDTAKANIGVPYSTLNVAGAVRVENTYKFRQGLVASVETNLTEIKPTSLAVISGVQAVALNAPVTRYMPGVKTIGGFNWATGVDLSTYSITQFVTTADLYNVNVPPIMTLDVRADIAFAIGHKPYAGGATNLTARLAESPTNLWDNRNTDKSYPTAIANEGAGWGRRELHAFRAYLTPAQATRIIASNTDALGAYTTLSTDSALA